MKAMRLVLINVLVLLVIVGGVLGGVWYYNQSTQYYKTDDASVQAPLTDVTAVTPGVVTQIVVKPGDTVNAGQAVAQVQTSATTIDPKTKEPVTTPVTADVTAVAGGTVVNLPIKVGDLVTPGQTVAVLASLDKVYVTVNVEETRVQDVQAGQKVDVTIDAYPSTLFSGKVERVSDATAAEFSVLPAMNSYGNYNKVIQRIPVTIELDSTAGAALKPGMNASVTIHVK